MKPKEFIKYTQMLDRKSLAICDGISEPYEPMSILYPLFIITGIGIFITLIIYWDRIRDFIKR